MYCAVCKEEAPHLEIFWLHAVCAECRKELKAIGSGAYSRDRRALEHYIMELAHFLHKNPCPPPVELLGNLSTKQLNELCSWLKTISRISL